MHVKICGITRADDAQLAAELGATALGFVLWPGSPREVDPFRARTIVRHLPPLVSVVGVFVDQPIEYVRRVARLVPLDAVQLHGGESADYCRNAGLRVIKAVGVGGTAAEEIDRLPCDVVILLDACDPVQHGGTGRRFSPAACVPRTSRRPSGVCARSASMCHRVSKRGRG